MFNHECPTCWRGRWAAPLDHGQIAGFTGLLAASDVNFYRLIKV
jgi:hypothetical protein